MNSTFYNNLINFADVDFDLVLFYILHLTSVANGITGWYYGVGEARLYAIGVASGINYIRGLNDGEVRFRSGVTSTVSIRGFVWSNNSLLKVRINFLGFSECFFDKAVQQRKYTLITTQSDFKSSMNPRFVTGFVYGEGCFNISITKKNNLKIGWNVQLVLTDLLWQDKLARARGGGENPPCK